MNISRNFYALGGQFRLYTHIYTVSNKQRKLPVLNFSKHICYSNWWHWSFLKLWSFDMVCQIFFLVRENLSVSSFNLLGIIHICRHFASTQHECAIALSSLFLLCYVFICSTCLDLPFSKPYPLYIDLLMLLRYFSLPLVHKFTVTNAAAFQYYLLF